MTSESIYEIERVTNSYIASGSAVTASVYRKEEVILAIDNSESATQSNPIEQTRIDKNLLRGAPKGAALDMDELRLVCIDNLDLNPCGGTHLKRISEINLLKVLSIEKDRGALRVRFVSGLRALNYFNSCISNENKLNMLLAVPPKEHTLFVEKLLKDKKDQLKQIEKNNLELAELYGKDLVNKCVDHLSKKIRETKYYFVVNSSLIIMDLRINTNLQFIINSGNHILKQLETKQNELVANGITNTILILFATNDDIVINANSKKGKKGTEQENQDEPIKLPIHTSGPFILFGENDIVNIVRDDILNTITGKGGGRPGRLQGQAKNIENYSEIIPQLKNKLV